ncbi:hypothetical protein F2Q69_00046866 [Brassica cretica]|uniref:Uncharacterized protein n=1 Tax=Brassica cretica TaxID=69181 RepID=A0A8S9Q043_BRACR|nr:hypothetical protein F2Q69_00046866 [Brassica cretica]
MDVIDWEWILFTIPPSPLLTPTPPFSPSFPPSPPSFPPSPSSIIHKLRKRERRRRRREKVHLNSSPEPPHARLLSSPPPSSATKGESVATENASIGARTKPYAPPEVSPLRLGGMFLALLIVSEMCQFGQLT